MSGDSEPHYHNVQISIPEDDSDWIRNYEPDEDLEKLKRIVRSRYDAGEPLFTKDNIRAAVSCRDRCLRNPTTLNEFLMPGYHGKRIRVSLYPAPRLSESQRESLRSHGPFIHYCTIESMLNKDLSYDEQLTLPLVIRIGSTWYRASEDEDAVVIQWTSPNALTDHFLQVQHEWRATEYYATFKQALLPARFPTSINKIIGYGLGSYYVLGKVPEKRSLLQHAIILLLRDILSFRNGRGQVQCFLQDPSYTVEEKNTNGALGMTVVDDPDGFLMVDDESVIVSIAPNVPVKQIVLDLCRPAAIIWMTDETLSDEMVKQFPMTDPESTRVRSTLRQYYDVIHLPDGEAATDLRLYVRRP